MTDNQIELACSETLKGLFNKYKDDEYMSQRLYNHIVNYLPNTLDNEMKNQPNLKYRPRIDVTNHTSYPTDAWG